jgi:hypothetical protein
MCVITTEFFSEIFYLNANAKISDLRNVDSLCVKKIRFCVIFSSFKRLYKIIIGDKRAIISSNLLEIDRMIA